MLEHHSHFWEQANPKYERLLTDSPQYYGRKLRDLQHLVGVFDVLLGCWDQTLQHIKPPSSSCRSDVPGSFQPPLNTYT